MIFSTKGPTYKWKIMKIRNIQNESFKNNN